jgi:cytoskeletal protein CcmA (bactofilin family)
MLTKTLQKVFFIVSMTIAIQPAIAQQHLQGASITVSAPVHGDLYITAGKVSVNAPVYGDLIIAGGYVEINDSVYNDVLLAAGEATLKGFIGDDLRCVGGRLRVSQNVAGDILLAGGDVVIDSTALVGSITGSGGTITINGTVKGDVYTASGHFILNGRVEGMTHCKAKEIVVNGVLEQEATLAASRIIIGPASWFGKSVRYWNKAGKISSNNPFIRSSAVYDPSLRMEYDKWYYLGHNNALMLLFHLGMVILLLITIQSLFGPTFEEAGKLARLRPGKALLNGVLYFAGIPFLCIVALATVIAIPLALIVSVLYIILLLINGTIAALMLAHWWNEKKHYDWPVRLILLTATGTYIIIKLVSMLPLAGPVILIALGCWTFGSIILAVQRRRLLKTSRNVTG